MVGGWRLEKRKLGILIPIGEWALTIWCGFYWGNRRAVIQVAFNTMNVASVLATSRPASVRISASTTMLVRPL